eukprot:TRINITY_DN18482_c0_g3_i1.p1 TRINITY_DN18482_c0_g3~~TRINITY_DN18482_c0_g3_i1.p1  ORF type:complete len:478 (+),score=161.81 TRINITY_DN18482_c0_g3_i1:151-1434(+)
MEAEKERTATELKAVEEKYSEIEKTLQGVLAEKSQLINEISSLEGQLSQEKSSSASTQDQLKEELQQLLVEKNSLEEALSALKEEKAALFQDLEKYSEVEQKLENVLAEKSKLVDDMSGLENQLNEKKEEFRVQLERLTGEKSSMNEEILSLKSQQAELHQDLVRLNEELSNYKKLKDPFKRTVEKIGGTIDDLSMEAKSRSTADLFQLLPDNLAYEAHCASQGAPDSEFRIACVFADGTNGVEVNTAEAIKWFKSAAEHGNAAAQKRLAELFRTGHDGRFDGNPLLALTYYKMSAASGSADSQFKGAVIALSHPENTEVNAETCVQWLRQAVVQQHVKAEATLGTCYLEGKLIPMDLMKGIKLLKKAGESGDPIAMHNLGYAYKQGLGVEKDEDRAEAYLELAVSLDADGILSKQADSEPALQSYR